MMQCQKQAAFLETDPGALKIFDFDTGRLGQNGTQSVAAPAAPGSYVFFCAIHPSMVGTLVVE